MAADVNPDLLTATGPSTGLRVSYLLKKKTDGTYERGWPRGFGGPGVSNGANTTSPSMHNAVTQTYDDLWTVGTVSVTNTATRLDNAQWAGAAVINYRKGIWVKNQGDRSIYTGPDNTVDAPGGAQVGIELIPGAVRWFPIGEILQVWAITAAGTNADIKVEQWS